MKLYEHHTSGNCYKVRLLCHLLKLPVELVEIDTKKGETRTPEFLTRNPAGKVPVLEVEPGVYLPESNAILCYLAEGSAYLPTDRLKKARVLQWLFFEQYSHEPYVAVARSWLTWKGIPLGKEAELGELHRKGYAALDVMEQALRQQPFLVDGKYSIADISLYAYTHHAHEGGFSLERYPALRSWIDRVASQPEHVPINDR